MPIQFIDRETGDIVQEKVEGLKYIQWMYSDKVYSKWIQNVFKRKIPTAIYGKLQDTKYSARKISKMVQNHAIDMEEYDGGISDYQSFNDFFARKLKPESRLIDLCENSFVSPADGKILAYDPIDIHRLIQVKGHEYSLIDLLKNNDLAQRYSGGVCFVIRLAPSDYHRFHFPVSGVIQDFNRIKGSFHSVNPLALNEIKTLYAQNKREYTCIETELFSTITMVEVGATFVGSIVQEHYIGENIHKGQEKGYFKFGGSTVILFVEKDQILVDEDLIENTQRGLETKIKMGEKIAVKK